MQNQNQNQLDNTNIFLYDCSECNNTVSLNPKDSIVCKKCGSRILYKKRINKKVEYLAR